MQLFKAMFQQAFLLLPLIQLVIAVIGPLQGPECTSLGTCATKAATSRTKCNPRQCPKYCSEFRNKGPKERRSIASIPHTKSRPARRFFENPDPNKFPYELLSQHNTVNICPDSGKNTYIWHKLSTERRDYAAALEGLSGCTTIFVASKNGVFSSHIWEEDQANKPKRDLSLEAYKDTLTDLEKALSPHKDDLKGGEAFLIIPTDPDRKKPPPGNPANYLYDVKIVDAIKKAIQDAAGLAPNVKTYIPLDFGTSTELGTTKRGTFSFQFDPKFKKKNGGTTRAYRIIGEGVLHSEKTDL